MATKKIKFGAFGSEGTKIYDLPCNNGTCIPIPTGENAKCYCNPGYKAAIDGFSCQACEAGTYSAVGGYSTSCYACQTCQVVGAEQSPACTSTFEGGPCTCPKGKVISQAYPGGVGGDFRIKKCDKCDAGYYTDTENATACKKCTTCGANFIDTGNCVRDQTFDTVCTCPANFGYDPINKTCTSCPSDKYNPFPGGGCIRCEAGTQSYYLGLQCLPCSSGTFTDGPNQICRSCTDCSMYGSLAQEKQACTTSTNRMCGCIAGAGLINGVCTTCPIGYTVVGDGISQPQICQKCAPNQISAGGAAACVTCAAGKQPDPNNLNSCIACTTGYSATGGPCIPCAPGYQPNSGRTACESCISGKYSTDGIACLQCSSCPPGQSVGQACLPTSDTICCPNGTAYVNGVCVSCQEGYYSTGISCNVCEVGNYCTTGIKTACGPGTFADVSGLSVCKSAFTAGGVASINDVAVQTGATGYTACATGLYTTDGISCINCLDCTSQNKVITIACTGTVNATCGTCLSGYYDNGSGCASCTNCASQNRITATACTDTSDAICGTCLSGYYDNNGVCTACTSCSAPGMVTLTACSATSDAVCGCGPGYIGNATTPGCYICGAGAYRGGNTTLTSGSCGYCGAMKSCPPGSTSSGACTWCKPGTAGLSVAGACGPAKAGTGVSVYGAARSDGFACATGVSPPGATTCTVQCPPGSTSSGGKTCSLCPAGQYNPTAGGTCSPCPPESPLSPAGSSQCYAACPYGTYKNQNGVCIACDTGFYNNDTLDATACQLCPNSKTSLDGISCVCPVGTKVNGQGGCSICSTNQYSNTVNSVSCSACDTNTYSRPGSFMCCPIGTSLWDGKCKPCDKGYYSSTQGLIGTNSAGYACSACPVGQTTDGIGSTVSTQCHV